MRISIFLVLFLSLASTRFTSAQQIIPHWDKWEYLVGEWNGEGNGKPGMGSGLFSFSKELDGKIMVRKGHTEFPASGSQTAAIHDDLMVINIDFSGNPTEAFYFDNEGHTISYSVSYSGESIILTSELIPGSPRFRLTYQKIDNKSVNIIFAISSPQTPDDFKTYLEGKSMKAN